MTRIWKIPLFVLATAYFVVDGLFSYVTRPISAWIGKLHLFQRVRRWIVSLRPYPSLALFAVPVIILEPIKPLAGYLVATGHLLSGAATLIAGEMVKLTCVERLFELNRTKLLSIPAFATAYGCWRRMMDAVELTKIWKASRRFVNEATHILRRHWLQFKRARALYRLQFRSLRLQLRSPR
jgi:hypothetical protein